MFQRLQQLHLEGNIDEVKHIASVEPNSKSIIISLVCGAINHCPHDIYLSNQLLILIKQTRIRAPINTFTCIHYHPFHTEFLFGRSHKHRRNWPCSSKISSGKEWFIQLSSLLYSFDPCFNVGFVKITKTVAVTILNHPQQHYYDCSLGFGVSALKPVMRIVTGLDLGPTRYPWR